MPASRRASRATGGSPPKILLEGRPGSGKTTAARTVAKRLRAAGVSVSGFTTAEIRYRGTRRGFTVEDLQGGRARLAHVDLPGPPRVGKYGVDLEAFERVALPALEDPKGVVIIDELGKMEIASRRFRDAVTDLFGTGVPIVATVHAYRHPFTDSLKRRRDVEVVRLTRANREALPEELVERFVASGR